MTTEQQTIPIDIRDLPELERVSIGGPANHVISIVVWFLASVVLGAGFALAVDFLIGVFAHHWIGPVLCVLLGTCFAAMAGAWLARKKLFDWQWDSDQSGLTVHGLFRVRHIAWSEITEVQGKPRSAGRIYYLKTASSRFGVADMMPTSGELMGASIYQHLRRFGKADESLLTPGARSFWMSIPNEVPDEMDWHHPNPPNWSIAAVVTVVILIAAPVAYFLGSKLKVETIINQLFHSAWLLVIAAYKALRDRLIVARQVAIRKDHIEMRTARRNVYLPWAEIKHVHWDNSRKSMALGRTALTDVGVVPYRANDPDSAACILAIIRHLRRAHHTPPVAIPTQLLPVLCSGALAPVKAFSEGDAVEVKVMNRSVLLLLPFVFAPALCIWWLMRDFRRLFAMPAWVINVMFFAPVALAVLVVVLTLVVRTVYRADSQGITVRSLVRRRFIDWRDVAAYIVSVRGTRSKRVLTDPSGRVLVSIPFSDRAQPSAEQFFAFLDARLAPVRQQDFQMLVR